MEKKKDHLFNKDNAKEMGARGGKVSKRKPFDERMKDWILNEISDNGTTNEDLIRKVLLKQAVDGNIQAIKEILDRTYGKAKQNLNVEGNIKTEYTMVNKAEGDV